MVRRDPERSHDMAKRKAQTSAKPRSGTKTRSKMKRAKPVRGHNTRARSKHDAVLALLSRPQGATIAAMEATGWQTVSEDFQPRVKIGGKGEFVARFCHSVGAIEAL